MSAHSGMVRMTGPKSGVGTVKAADAHHQQHRERRVLRADDRASEREHRPIGHDHADLRQQVDADQAAAGEIEGELGEPEGERGTEIGAELELVADREHVRHVAGRPGIEQRTEPASTAAPASAPPARPPAPDANATVRRRWRRKASAPTLPGVRRTCPRADPSMAGSRALSKGGHRALRPDARQLNSQSVRSRKRGRL